MKPWPGAENDFDILTPTDLLVDVVLSFRSAMSSPTPGAARGADERTLAGGLQDHR